MIKEEAVYWIALAHLTGWRHLNINRVITKFYYEQNISIENFFHLNESEWKYQYLLSEDQVKDLHKIKADLASIAFFAESLFSQGYDIIPITSPEYSKKLKINLKISHAPAVLYVKGNKKLLQKSSVAIIGSRNASNNALIFTDNIAKLATDENKVVVSGYAKGVDQKALESAIKFNGQSIIVLPQGIMTFGYGLKKYYRQILNGDVLVLSTFFPRAPWKAELAMARNSIIYGLADEIYVAESADKGGTWSGVIDGLRKGRKIYIRKPEPYEHTANNLLIQKGAIAVDLNGKPIQGYEQHIKSSESIFKGNESLLIYKNKIFDLLRSGEFNVKEIKKRLKLPFKEKEIRDFLKAQKEVKIFKKRQYFFSIKDSTNEQKSLFD